MGASAKTPAVMDLLEEMRVVFGLYQALAVEMKDAGVEDSRLTAFEGIFPTSIDDRQDPKLFPDGLHRLSAAEKNAQELAKLRNQMAKLEDRKG